MDPDQLQWVWDRINNFQIKFNDLCERAARNCLGLAVTRKPFLLLLKQAWETTKPTFSSAAEESYQGRSTTGKICSMTPTSI
jgi:hypothetical protein